MTVPRKYAAVTILAGRHSCHAVSSLKTVRILATGAPPLPVPNCHMPRECGCRFKKYVDRREDDEGRRFCYGLESSAWYSGNQRRKSQGRRERD